MRKYRVPLPEAATKNYKITVEPLGKTIEVDVSQLPFSRHGLPGSILDIVNHFEDDLIEHTCGGVQACSTCHIYVDKGEDNCNEPSEREEDYLDNAPALQMNSRLACCCVPDGTADVTIRIPKWNKNEVKENG